MMSIHKTFEVFLDQVIEAMTHKVMSNSHRVGKTKSVGSTMDPRPAFLHCIFGAAASGK